MKKHILSLRWFIGLKEKNCHREKVHSFKYNKKLLKWDKHVFVVTQSTQQLRFLDSRTEHWLLTDLQQWVVIAPPGISLFFFWWNRNLTLAHWINRKRNSFMFDLVPQIPAGSPEQHAGIDIVPLMAFRFSKQP